MNNKNIENEKLDLNLWDSIDLDIGNIEKVKVIDELINRQFNFKPEPSPRLKKKMDEINKTCPYGCVYKPHEMALAEEIIGDIFNNYFNKLNYHDLTTTYKMILKESIEQETTPMTIIINAILQYFTGETMEFIYKNDKHIEKVLQEHSKIK